MAALIDFLLQVFDGRWALLLVVGGILLFLFWFGGYNLWIWLLTKLYPANCLADLNKPGRVTLLGRVSCDDPIEFRGRRVAHYCLVKQELTSYPSKPTSRYWVDKSIQEQSANFSIVDDTGCIPVRASDARFELSPAQIGTLGPRLREITYVLAVDDRVCATGYLEVDILGQRRLVRRSMRPLVIFPAEPVHRLSPLAVNAWVPLLAGIVLTGLLSFSLAVFFK